MKNIILFLFPVLLLVACTSSLDKNSSEVDTYSDESDFTSWVLYVSPSRSGDGTYEAYRCQYCRQNESQDVVVRDSITTIKHMLDNVGPCTSNSCKQRESHLQRLEDSLVIEQKKIQTVIDELLKFELKERQKHATND